MLGASAALPFLPMQPIQILLQNLLYDISQTSIPWDTMDDEYVATPRRWDASGIARFMIVIGPISSIFDYATFALMYFVFQAQQPHQQSLFQSGWFVESMLSQSLIVHMIRTRKVPFIQSHATAPVLVVSIGIMLIAVALPYSLFAQSLRLQPLPLSYFGWLAVILLAYLMLTQIMKNWYIRRYREWL
jgi:Mg2+-importing ATPase